MVWQIDEAIANPADAGSAWAYLEEVSGTFGLELYWLQYEEGFEGSSSPSWFWPILSQRWLGVSCLLVGVTGLLIPIPGRGIGLNGSLNATFKRQYHPRWVRGILKILYTQPPWERSCD